MTQLRVLIVEDRLPDAELMIREIRRGGYEPVVELVTTRDGMSAALEKQQWDVVLADYNLPDFGGPEALSLIRQKGVDVPFIIVSGTVTEQTAVEAMRAGAHDYLLKSSLTRLLPAVEREVRDAQLRREQVDEHRRIEAERERLLAELQEAVRARDTFLAIASHELKTPLTTLQIQLRLLDKRQWPVIEDGSTHEIRAAIDMIARQVARLQGLIGNLLDVVHITSGRMSLSTELVNLREIVADVVGQLRQGQPSQPDVSVQADPVMGVWDRVRIESVVTNLVSNAIKFGEGKPILVKVTSDGSKALLAVTDQGIGLSPEQQTRIFEKFERAVSERHYGGFGLGLWIARHIVEAHGGTIRVDSAAGRGSTFVAELPLNVAATT